jgi:hypothetical protein
MLCRGVLCCAVQVLEFVCFKERLERSHNFMLARAERAALRIRTAALKAGEAGAAAEAVAAAVAALPLSQLQSCDWQGMRFNDDLTTRLPWLPPIQGPRQLVVLQWWEQQQQQQQRQGGGAAGGAAAGACWWRQVAAAEADVPAAAALRASMKAAVQQRWLLPHLLQSALDIFSSGSGSTSAVRLSELLPHLAGAMGCSSVPELQQAAAAAFGSTSSSSSSSSSSPNHVPLSKQLQLLNAALFTLANGLQVSPAVMLL